ncbi:MAG TPA: YciI family protein [Solirubrobacteraceae bacterium]|nr:YciI family protein [Solirubrobacteraceae bacterium]
MTQYQLAVYHPEDEPPDDLDIDQVYADVDALNHEMKAAGAWVFGGGLHPSHTATVLQVRDDEVLVTDGPFAEGKEHVGGFWVIEAPDLDAALEWGRKATLACRVPIEVRPFRDDDEA